MKRKRFLAVLTAASLSASMALTAMPVFAGDVVSVEASDAKTVDSPAGGTNATAEETAIRSDLAGGTVTINAANPATGIDALSNKKETYSVAGAGTTYTYGVTAVSGVTFGLNSAKDDIDSAKVTLTLSVSKKDNGVDVGVGNATITVDLLNDVDLGTNIKFTADQKLAALKTLAEARVAAVNEGNGFVDTDNEVSILAKTGLDSTSLAAKTNLTKIIADQTSNGTIKTEGYSKAAKISAVNVKEATKATSSTDGSLPFEITYSVDVYGSDEKTTTKTDTSALTGVIPKTKQQNDATYEAKIEAAIEAATWTSDDFNATGADLSTKGYQKLYNLIKGVDNNTLVEYDADTTKISGIGSASAATVASLDKKVNIGRYTAGTHGKDGAATVSFYAARKDGGSQKIDSFSVKLTVVEGDGHVQSELTDAFNNGVAAAAKSLQKDPVADQDAAVKVIKDAIDAELAKTYNDKAYSADIDSYEIVVPKDKYTAATTTAEGTIEFYVKVNTGRTSSADSTKKDVWYFVGDSAVSAAPWYSNDIKYDSTLTSDTAAATATHLIDIQKLAKAVEVDATSIALPSAISYNVKVAGADTDASKVTGIKLKDYLTINPDGANTYKIRWTNSNSKFTLSDGTNSFGDSYIITATSSDNNSATLPVLKYLGSGTATTTIKADLLDADGNTVSSASAVVTALSGFDDVQNKSYFAYDAINALASTLKKETTTGAGGGNKTINNGNYDETVTLKSNEIISSSPVIQGTGSNKFDPYTDVTRAQFVTFLYRNACNEYTFTSTGYDKDPASYTATTKFSDVAADKYYAKAVAWAVDNGIVNGKTDTTFAPDAKITRAEAVTMIYRLQANGSNYSNWQSFTDVNASAYYANAVGYAANYKITNGKTPTTFAPNDNVTRGEAAAFIFRAVAGEDGFYITAD